MPTRRPLALAPLLVLGFILPMPTGAAEPSRPNVLLIITDDQGYGDLGAHGNPVIRTPNLDRLARESVQLTRFQVSPVCSPTRASLMTGRWNYRTGVVDTYIGRSMMRTEELTLAEILRAGGYRTGIFGKWHLGDNYPLRAIDQGFDEALTLRGGGIDQASDAPEPGGSSYFDPVLDHNGKSTRARGYCSDVFATAAIDFLSKPDPKPFFAYIAFNAPHTPLQVADDEIMHYRQAPLGPDAFPQKGQPWEGGHQEETARVYAMVSNIDRNVGRVLDALKSQGLDRSTIVVFLTDNGPQQPRFNGGLRGRKGTVYDGGIRVPCFIRWPGEFEAGKQVDRIAAHIDLAPTLLEACGVDPPAGAAFDGISLFPLLTGTLCADDWSDRILFTQWHRGDRPEAFRAFAARSQRWKLVRADRAAGPQAPEPRFELFDTEADPYEQTDLSAAQPEELARLKAAYEAWFRDVARPENFEPVRILVGSDLEPVTRLSRQDWRGPRAGWDATSLGHWELQVERAGPYEVELLIDPPAQSTTLQLTIGARNWSTPVAPGADRISFRDLELPTGPTRLEASLKRGTSTIGARYAIVRRRP